MSGADDRAGAVPPLRVAAFDELDARTLHDILRLRVDVFVVEQRCPYPEVDGRDVEPATRHCWTEEDGGVAAYLRLVAEPAGMTRLGRVVTAPAARGRGHATRLVRHALDDCPGPVVADAQAHLVHFYRRMGFAVTGPEYLDYGIPHVPMRAR